MLLAIYSIPYLCAAPMNSFLRYFALLPFAITAHAAPIEGRLEIVWGDSAPGAPESAPEYVNLVDLNGRRIALDPAQARQAAGDLYALFGKPVLVELGTGKATAQGLAVELIASKAQPEAIPQPRVAGTTVWATILCKFSDIATEQKPLSFFTGQYGTAEGQLDHYWREVSYNKINLTGSAAYGWFTLPQPRSFYVPAMGSANLNKLWDDCTAAADASVNFAANGGLQGVNMMFNGDLDGFAWGGGRCATLDGVNKCWSATWNPPWSFNNSAPLSHEMGHAYGLQFRWRYQPLRQPLGCHERCLEQRRYRRDLWHRG